MKHKKMQISVLLLGLGLTTYAQQATTASGGNASGSGGSVAYSVGQIVYTAHTGTTGTVSEGVQQAYQIFTVGINETDSDISLSVFPNPTADNLSLQIGNYKNEKFSYQLFDMQGKLLNDGEITARQTPINTASLATATYFIHVVNQENKKVQSFKIIKN